MTKKPPQGLVKSLETIEKLKDSILKSSFYKKIFIFFLLKKLRPILQISNLKF